MHFTSRWFMQHSSIDKTNFRDTVYATVQYQFRFSSYFKTIHFRLGHIANSLVSSFW